MKTKTTQWQQFKTLLSRWLDQRCPPGINWKHELGAIAGANISGFMINFIEFATDFDECLGRLYYDEERTKLLDPANPSIYAIKNGIYMPSFEELIELNLLTFVIIALIMIPLAAYHYRYHFQSSKSIYLMKRLPDTKDLTRRCLTIPILGAVATLLTALVLTGICYAMYMILTPEQYL